VKIRYSYMQRCVAECSGVLDVPDDAIAGGEHTVYEYIRDHEVDAKHTDIDVRDWNEEVEGTMEWEEA
jgi:hypothetical protein